MRKFITAIIQDLQEIDEEQFQERDDLISHTLVFLGNMYEKSTKSEKAYHFFNDVWLVICKEGGLEFFEEAFEIYLDKENLRKRRKN